MEQGDLSALTQMMVLAQYKGRMAASVHICLRCCGHPCSINEVKSNYIYCGRGLDDPL